MMLDFKWPKSPEKDFEFFKIKFKCKEFNSRRALNASTIKEATIKKVIPEHFLTRLKRFHSQPLAWWTGHFASYIMEFSNEFKKHLDHKGLLFDLPKPCVG